MNSLPAASSTTDLTYDTLAPTGNFAECTENGLFPLNDANCQTYHLCLLVMGTFLSLNLTCPGTTRFNPDTQKCVDDYPCLEEMATTVKPFECTAPGSFVAPEDTTCRSYYFCVKFNMTFVTLKLNCPAGNYFDPATTTCVTPDVYACGANKMNATTSSTTQSTTISTTRTTSTTISTTTAADVCTTSGRYPVAGDKTCQFYYLCLQTSNGFRRAMFQCPNTTLFNPNRQLCVAPTSFICPA